MEVCAVVSKPNPLWPTTDTEECKHRRHLPTPAQRANLLTALANKRLMIPGCLLCLCWIGCSRRCCVCVCVWWDQWGVVDQIRAFVNTMSSLYEVQEPCDRLNTLEIIISKTSWLRCVCQQSAWQPRGWSDRVIDDWLIISVILKAKMSQQHLLAAAF